MGQHTQFQLLYCVQQRPCSVTLNRPITQMKRFNLCELNGYIPCGSTGSFRPNPSKLNGPIHANSTVQPLRTNRLYSVLFNGSIPRDPNPCKTNGPIHYNSTAPVRTYNPTAIIRAVQRVYSARSKPMQNQQPNQSTRIQRPQYLRSTATQRPPNGHRTATQRSPNGHPTVTPSPANKLIERYNGVWSFCWSRKPRFSSVKLTSSPKQKAVGSMITKPERHEKMANVTDTNSTDIRGDRRVMRGEKRGTISGTK